ncbi:MAG: DNA-3-methyladenine glycosylase [Longimicrobiales bacterium]
MAGDDATPWAWRSACGKGSGEPICEAFLRQEAALVARGLLGATFRSTVDGSEVVGVVVEAEAYVGPWDPASHAAERIGRTRRNESMFGPPGRAYVYRSYGIHWCLNVVTGEEGFPAAVLIRALEVIRGLDRARARRRGREPLSAGPGRLCQALAVSGAMDGHALAEPPLQLFRGWAVPDEAVAVSGRVGIRRAADWPLRFFLRGHPQVSRGPREAGPVPTARHSRPGTVSRKQAEFKHP